MRFFSRENSEALRAEIGRLTDKVGELKAEVAKLTKEAAAAGEAVKLQERIVSLQKELTTLEVTKSKSDEAFERREREITHKVGLERTRQEQELKLARREALVEVGEKNLAAERKEFEDRMKFREAQFDSQTKRFDSLLSDVIARLPVVTVGQTHEIKESVRKR